MSFFGGGGSGVEFTKDWEVSVKLCAGAAAVFPKAMDFALKRLAVEIEGKIKSNIKAGPPPPQSKHTTATGGKGKPLNRAGDLGNSPNTVHAGHHAYFVGIPRSSGSFNLAVIHEQGAIVVQEMSERMRRFLHANLPGKAPSGGTGHFVVSQIPARPFVQPAIDDIQPVFAKQFAHDFAMALRGRYGTP